LFDRYHNLTTFCVLRFNEKKLAPEKTLQLGKSHSLRTKLQQNRDFLCINACAECMLKAYAQLTYAQFWYGFLSMIFALVYYVVSHLLLFTTPLLMIPCFQRTSFSSRPASVRVLLCLIVSNCLAILPQAPLFSQPPKAYAQSLQSFGNEALSANATLTMSAAVPQESMRLVKIGSRQVDGFYSLARAERVRMGGKQAIAQGLYLKTKQRIIADTKQAQSSITHEAIRALFVTYAENLRSVKEITPTLDNTFITAITFDSKTDVRKLCAELESLSDVVEYAEPMQILKPHQTLFPTPNDPLFARQYHWQRIRAQEAWALTAGDSSVVVAVCDTGVDWEHEDLADNIWTNPGESGRDAAGRDKRTNGVDDDRNGKIDDWHGWDFVGAASEVDLLQGVFREDNDPKLRFANGLVPMELPNHGTHVAGSVAARANNARGGTGVAFRCKILPIKCSTDGVRIDGIYRGYEAMLYAAQMGAKVIVCSFGGGRYSRFEQDIINTVTQMGALVVAAAGNDGKVTDNIEFPASYDNVLAVGSSNQADRAVPSSDFGLLVDVFAPGENIWSTASGNEYTDSFSGTSMATPIVAGVAALVRSLHPDWSPRQIIQQLRATSDNTLLGAGSTLNRPFGYFGRLNAVQALTATQPGLMLQNVSIGAATGIVQDVQPVQLRLPVQNVLASAQNVSVTLFSLDNKAATFESVQSLGTINANIAQTATFSIQLSPSALTGTGLRTAEFVVIFQAANGYLNYERLSVPYNIRTSLGAQMLVPPMLDFSSAAQTTLPALLLNAGATPLSISNVSISGANAGDFTALPINNVPLAIGATNTVSVRFAPQSGLVGSRTAVLQLTAQPVNTLQRSAIAGGYEFVSARSAYNEFSDGTLLAGAALPVDDVTFTVPIGFSFRFGGEVYSNITISSNGFCAFSPAESLVQSGSVVTRPLSTSLNAKGYIAACGADIVIPATGDMRLKTEGTAPNRTMTVQWRNATFKAASESRLNFQIRLYETSERIEIIYGTCTMTAALGVASVDVGLRGASSNDIHSRRVSEDIRAAWTASAESTSNEDACEMSATALPPTGLLYRWSALAVPRSSVSEPIVRQIILRGVVSMPTDVALESTPQPTNFEWRVSPNPVHDEARVEYDALPEAAQMRVCNALGEIVFAMSMDAAFEKRSFSINTSAWAQGVYIMTITTSRQTLHRRLYVLR
jgi:hypothetical protein